jgi:hypothetical protein
VKVTFVLNEKGEVESVDVKSGHPMLKDATVREELESDCQTYSAPNGSTTLSSNTISRAKNRNRNETAKPRSSWIFSIELM